MEDARALVGTEVGVSDWVLVDQDRINKFAEATDDFQWIHIDEERCATELPIGSTIAHGYLTVSLIPSLIQHFVDFVDLERVINYGMNKVRFKAMVPVNSKVRVRATLKSARKRAGALQFILNITVEVEGQKRPACEAETIGLYFLAGV
jgi:acyl dehydratase|tara:strand:+ start:653 stop:1099 length:447 start_codon:yes stop_codon:yes gene_type:complete